AGSGGARRRGRCRRASPSSAMRRAEAGAYGDREMSFRLEMTVNGEPVAEEIEPRQHLADFLRDRLHLKGTHLGCEHGACGACTVTVDGRTTRSCIVLAASCARAEVRTIEGFDDDPLMARLRRKFSEEHALQCGYCTP